MADLIVLLGAIARSLHDGLRRNALFLAERLLAHAQVSSNSCEGSSEESSSSSSSSDRDHAGLVLAAVHIQASADPLRAAEILAPLAALAQQTVQQMKDASVHGGNTTENAHTSNVSEIAAMDLDLGVTYNRRKLDEGGNLDTKRNNNNNKSNNNNSSSSSSSHDDLSDQDKKSRWPLLARAAYLRGRCCLELSMLEEAEPALEAAVWLLQRLPTISSNATAAPVLPSSTNVFSSSSSSSDKTFLFPNKITSNVGGDDNQYSEHDNAIVVDVKDTPSNHSANGPVSSSNTSAPINNTSKGSRIARPTSSASSSSSLSTASSSSFSTSSSSSQSAASSSAIPLRKTSTRVASSSSLVSSSGSHVLPRKESSASERIKPSSAVSSSAFATRKPSKTRMAFAGNNKKATTSSNSSLSNIANSHINANMNTGNHNNSVDSTLVTSSSVETSSVSSNIASTTLSMQSIHSQRSKKDTQAEKENGSPNSNPSESCKVNPQAQPQPQQNSIESKIPNGSTAATTSATSTSTSSCDALEDKRNIEEAILGPIPSLASVHYLLGLVCRRTNRTEQAIKHLKTALKLDNLLWSAFEELCSLDPQNVNPDEFYSNSSSNTPLRGSHSPESLHSFVTKSNPTIYIEEAEKAPKKPNRTIVHSKSDISSNSISSAKPSLNGKKSQRLFSTLSSSEVSSSSTSPGLLSSEVSSKATAPSQRKSSRLAAAAAQSTLRSKFGAAKVSEADHDVLVEQEKKRLRQGASSIPEFEISAKDSNLSDSEKNLHATNSSNGIKCPNLPPGIMSLFFNMANGLKCLHRYECKQAIASFQALPPQHFHTGWILARVGKAYVEMIDYIAAEAVYQKLFAIEPHRHEGAEIYSTVLWHLRRDIELSYLAHELSEYDRKSPEAWTAVGNCFSLQQDHESALRCFRRAVQLNPDFTYAHTLMGHEYVAVQDFEKAALCFRTSIRIDRRHYNAWYGLGLIFFRQDKFELAEFHFRRALDINPQSSVLYCYLGMVMHAMNRSEDALLMLDMASKIDPRNPLVRFKKANVLLKLNRLQESLHELNILKDRTPRESAVYFLLGIVHKRLGDFQKSSMYFTWAYDLDPEGSGIVKEALEEATARDSETE